MRRDQASAELTSNYWSSTLNPGVLPLLARHRATPVVAVGGMVVAKHVQRADHLHAGSVQGHQDHGLLFVFLGVRIGLAHDNGDL